MANYELVKETKIDGFVQYSIEKDGKYVSRSVTDSLDEAEKYLSSLVKGGNLETLREIIKTIAVDDKNDN